MAFLQPCQSVFLQALSEFDQFIRIAPGYPAGIIVFDRVAFDPAGIKAFLNTSVNPEVLRTRLRISGKSGCVSLAE